MPPFPIRPRVLHVAALVAAALLVPTAVSRAVAADPDIVVATRAGDAAALAEAQADSAAADAALEAVRSITTPGHLLDPAPERLMAGLGDLQAQYAELERRAAGYRATLGDQHPTLKGAEQVLADLRGQILDRARRVTARAAREAEQARGEVAALERRLRTADAAGGIAAAPAPRPPAALPRAPAPRPVENRAAPAIHDEAAGRPRMPHLPTLLLAAAALLAIGAALRVLVGRMRPRRRKPEAPARIEPAMPVETTAPADPAMGAPGDPIPSRRPRGEIGRDVPILATLPLPASAGPAAVRDLLGREPEGGLMRAAESVRATLAAASEGQARMTVLVAAAAGLAERDADAAAVAIAAAAAAAGRRVLLAEGDPDGRLCHALAPGAAPAARIDVDDVSRAIVRIAVAGRTIALLTAIPGQTDLIAPTGIGRLGDLSGFDVLVVAGGRERDGSTLDADLALLVAPRDAEASDLAEAAHAIVGPRGRPCGALLLEPAPAPALARTDPAPQLRRIAPEPAAPARLGLRRSFDPTRRRA